MTLPNKRLLPIDRLDELRDLSDVMVDDFVEEIEDVMSCGRWRQVAADDWGWDTFEDIRNRIGLLTLAEYGVLPVKDVKTKCDGEDSLPFHEFKVYEISVAIPPGKGTLAYRQWMDRVRRDGMSTAGLRRRQLRIHSTVTPILAGYGGQACEPKDIYVAVADMSERVADVLKHKKLRAKRVYRTLTHEMTHIMDPTPYEMCVRYDRRPSEVRAYARGWAEEVKVVLERSPGITLNEAIFYTDSFGNVHRSLSTKGVQEALKYVYQELIRSGHIKEG